VGTGETAKQVGEKIAALETREENVSYGVLDNACWANVGVTGPNIAEEINSELNKKHLVTFGKSSKGRVEGANAIKSRLLGNQQADGSYKPAIYFFSNCIHAIRTIPMLAHDKSKPETYDTNGEDHCCDSVAYAVLSRPWIPAKPKPPGTVDHWIEKKHKSAWTY
jgi:phage terminase large subunit